MSLLPLVGSRLFKWNKKGQDKKAGRSIWFQDKRAGRSIWKKVWLLHIMWHMHTAIGIKEYSAVSLNSLLTLADIVFGDVLIKSRTPCSNSPNVLCVSENRLLDKSDLEFMLQWLTLNVFLHYIFQVWVLLAAQHQLRIFQSIQNLLTNCSASWSLSNGTPLLTFHYLVCWVASDWDSLSVWDMLHKFNKGDSVLRLRKVFHLSSMKIKILWFKDLRAGLDEISSHFRTIGNCANSLTCEKFLFQSVWWSQLLSVTSWFLNEQVGWS